MTHATFIYKGDTYTVRFNSTYKGESDYALVCHGRMTGYGSAKDPRLIRESRRDEWCALDRLAIARYKATARIEFKEAVRALGIEFREAIRVIKNT